MCLPVYQNASDLPNLFALLLNDGDELLVDEFLLLNNSLHSFASPSHLSFGSCHATPTTSQIMPHAAHLNSHQYSSSRLVVIVLSFQVAFPLLVVPIS